MSSEPKRVLVSGFEAFGGASINPTAKLCELLQRAIAGESAPRSLPLPENLEIRSILLPVTFDEAYLRLREEVDAFDPHAIVAFGQAGGRDAVELERIAINVIDADIPDNKGALIQDRPVSENGAAAHFSSLPLRQILSELKQENIPARISNTAGAYVCNFLFYRMMEENSGNHRRCGFVHVPYLPEQVMDKPGVPSMPLETMAQALATILRVLAQP